MRDEQGRTFWGARAKRRTGAGGFRDLTDQELQEQICVDLCMADKPEILRMEQRRGCYETCSEVVRVLTEHYGVIVFIFNHLPESEEDELIRLLEEGFEWTGYKVRVKKGELGVPGAKQGDGDPVVMIELEDKVV